MDVTPTSRNEGGSSPGIGLGVRANIAHHALRAGMRTLSATLPGVAARVTERLWCTPPRTPVAAG
jgi:hypothetical protein